MTRPFCNKWLMAKKWRRLSFDWLLFDKRPLHIQFCPGYEFLSGESELGDDSNEHDRSIDEADDSISTTPEDIEAIVQLCRTVRYEVQINQQALRELLVNDMLEVPVYEAPPSPVQHVFGEVITATSRPWYAPRFGQAWQDLPTSSPSSSSEWTSDSA